MERLLLRIPECAERVGLSRAELYRAIKRGDLQARLIGKTMRVRPADLEAFANNLPVAGPKAVEA